jgi:putative restriction endonuclease
MSLPEDVDIAVRMAAFKFLEEQRSIYGDVLSSEVLRIGFPFRGERIKLMGPQGIFKPAILAEMPLSITTAPPDSKGERPYDDGFSPGSSVLFYRYRGTDPAHPDNRRLRLAMQNHRPLIYFHGLLKGKYLPAWPVYVVGDEPDRLRFRVEMDDSVYATRPSGLIGEGTEEARRQYVTAVTRRRLHQASFRVRVLRAYRSTCALCRLRHDALLDAAHIVADSDPLGEPLVANGVALCKLHHAAFDRDFLGIRPDYVVEVRADILSETDGPMLVHGLQGFHGQSISIPRIETMRPRQDFLEARYERFLSAGHK